jgi:hypothetical protein
MSEEQNVTSTPIGGFVHDSMISFGADVNMKRQLPLVYDGLKPVYRRVIYTMLRQGDRMMKTASIVGNCIATVHPHGSASVEQPVSNLVNWGIAEGQGNHGQKMLIGEDAERSAARYTEAKISKKYFNIFNELMPYVPYDPAEMAGFDEPRYLPTPVPLCLTFGTLGIGIGVNTRVPSFTVKSMMKALLKDNPKYLKAPFGMHIVPEKSNLDSLWNTGIGKVTYSYNVYQGESAGGYGTYIEGEAEIFKPRLSDFDEAVDLGRVYINDETDETGSRVFIGRNFNVKAISYDDIFDMAQKAAVETKTYRLTVTDGNNVYLVPLRSWLKSTYDSYVETINKYKSDKMAKYQFEYKVYDHLHEVAQYQFDHRDADDDEIAKKLKLDKDIVSSILSKNLRTLRNSDSGKDKLKGIKERIDFFTNLNPTDKIDEIINEF